MRIYARVYWTSGLKKKNTKHAYLKKMAASYTDHLYFQITLLLSYLFQITKPAVRNNV